MQISGLSSLLQALFLPNQCLICQRLEETNLCGKCQAKITISPTLWIQPIKANNPLFKPTHSTHIQELKDSLVISILTCTSIQDPIIRRCIHYLKYKNLPQLAKPLSQILNQVFSQHIQPTTSLVICPIPLHPARYKFRQYNQAELLSQAIINSFHLPVYEGLERVKNTPQQVRTQSKQERLDNMRNAFRAKLPNSNNNSILLLDDITTTLSTIQQAAKALNRQGFREIYGLVLAH